MATQVKRLPAIPNQWGAVNEQNNTPKGGDNGEKHFAAGLNFHKLFWVFLIGSMIGCLVETIFAFVMRGGYECRASLMHGPFNLIYGIGALTLYIGVEILKRKTKSKKWQVFLFGAVAGTVVEFISSWVQEIAFGAVSWDCSHLPLNIGGRVCLLFGVFWGLLALAWVIFLQPAFDKLIAKIPNALGKPSTWILCGFMIFNIVVSAAAVSRWLARAEGTLATTQVQVLLDKFYPDPLMEHNFGEMVQPRQAA